MGVLVVEGRTTRSKLVRADASHRSHADSMRLMNSMIMTR